MGIVRQRRKAETRALLLEAGLNVFAERGIEFTTLDEVARTAGFTKGAIYRQFPSKGAFLLALFEQYAAVARAAAAARPRGSSPSPCSSPPTRCAIRCSGGASRSC
jgi:AcrR family transcriptional regulator